jgi:hypothetical protein
MTRPDSHQSDLPDRRCETCRHAKVLAETLDTLCFHGDTINVVGKSTYPVIGFYVELNGREIVNDDSYVEIWTTRHVQSGDVCDEWEGH